MIAVSAISIRPQVCTLSTARRAPLGWGKRLNRFRETVYARTVRANAIGFLRGRDGFRALIAGDQRVDERAVAPHGP